MIPKNVFFWLLLLGIGSYTVYQIGSMNIHSTVMEFLRRYLATGINKLMSSTYAPSEVAPDLRFLFASIKDRDKYDSLSPDEAKQLLAQLAADIDFNSDGFIDRDELKTWIKKSARSLIEEEAARRFTVIDRNEDGMLTWKEVYDATCDPECEKRMQSTPGKEVTRRLRVADKEKFEAADVNKDRKLDSIEFVSFLAPEEFPRMSNFLLNRALRSKDANKDGRIDFQEFVTGQDRDGDNEWLQAEKKRFDTEYDTNGDGYLTDTEILAWAFPSSEVLAEGEVALLLKTAGEDLDARLSYREFIAKYHKKVATDSDKRVEEL